MSLTNADTEKQPDAFRAIALRLYEAMPALGHHDIPGHDCPAREIVNVMNDAAKLLGKPTPYPKFLKKN